MSLLQAFPARELARRGSIEDEDVARLRSLFEAGAELTCEEAGQLVGLNAACPVHHPDWAAVFVDVLTDHFVHQIAPEGYLDAAKSERFLALISREGRIASKTELELLLRVLDGARWAPVSLVCFALHQVRSAVATGEGPLRSGPAALPPGAIGEAELELIRRVLYAFAGHGCLAVTREEADALIQIDEAVAEPAPEAWTDLFAKAIANLVISASGHAVPVREQALARELWREPGSRISGNQAAAARAFGRLYRTQSAEERAIARLERQRIQIITGEELREADAEWIVERLAPAGRLSHACRMRIADVLAEAPAPIPLLDVFSAAPQSCRTAAG